MEVEDNAEGSRGRQVIGEEWGREGTWGCQRRVWLISINPSHRQRNQWSILLSFFFFWKKYDQSTDLKIIVYVTNNWIYVVDVRASPMHQSFD